LIIHVDTSVLIDAFVEPGRSYDFVEAAVDAHHELAISAPVLYEWLRGPRTGAQRAAMSEWFAESSVVAFDGAAAEYAAGIYRALSRSRPREIDIVIAACAIEHRASLWTLNVDDFSDIPGLRLYRP
jgi:predicted nucleic acid-binding protein